jgi:hypothetical protein
MRSVPIVPTLNKARKKSLRVLDRLVENVGCSCHKCSSRLPFAICEEVETATLRTLIQQLWLQPGSSATNEETGRSRTSSTRIEKMAAVDRLGMR